MCMRHAFDRSYRWGGGIIPNFCAILKIVLPSTVKLYTNHTTYPPPLTHSSNLFYVVWLCFSSCFDRTGFMSSAVQQT